MMKCEVRMPTYLSIIERRNDLLPEFEVTKDTFAVKLEDIIKSTTSSILSFLEKHFPERLSGIDEKTKLKLVSKVNF